MACNYLSPVERAFVCWLARSRRSGRRRGKSLHFGALRDPEEQVDSRAWRDGQKSIDNNRRRRRREIPSDFARRRTIQLMIVLGERRRRRFSLASSFLPPKPKLANHSAAHSSSARLGLARVWGMQIVCV